MNEKYSTKAKLDTDNHQKLLEENREAFARDRVERLQAKLRDLKQAQEHLPASEDLSAEIERTEAKLEEAGEELKWHQG